MYTTDIQDNGTVSATDEERLPPGGFSLRHGFPDWFGRGRRSVASSRQASGQYGTATPPPRGSISNMTTPESKPSPVGAQPTYMQTSKIDVSTYEVLRYIRSTFDDESVLDSIPLEAAGNPGAWHAWRTHRGQHLKANNGVAWHDGLSDGEEKKTREPPAARKSSAALSATRRPEEWNWEGVWEDRVKKGIIASLSEPVLYGGAGVTDDVVCSLLLSLEDYCLNFDLLTL
jgi:hypothetical protein